MNYTKDVSAGYLVNHLARLFAASLQARIGPLGLSTGVFPVMLQLWEADGLTQKELVGHIDVEQPTLANTLARMERDGLIERRKDAHDGRVMRAWLTEKGRALHAPGIVAAKSANGAGLSGLSDAEQAELLALLRKSIATFGGPGPHS